jgi:hypothetical protein
MKRTIASLASAALMLSIASPVFASPSFGPHARITTDLGRRGIKETARLANLSRRSNPFSTLAYRRTLYRSLVRAAFGESSGIPGMLAVTGNRQNSDTMKKLPYTPVSRRPADFTLQKTYGNHCAPDSRKCQDG